MSVPVSVISILFIDIIPLLFVVYSTGPPLFILTVNLAPCNAFWFSLSCFINCKLYEPDCFSFGTVTVIRPFSSFPSVPLGSVPSPNSILLAIYFPSLTVFVTFIVIVSIILL